MAYPHSPLVAFAVGIAVVVLLLAYWDLPALIGLIIATFAVGLVAPGVPLTEIASRTATAFGENMAGIGIPILMAAIIGKGMMSSGAAERIVRGFTALLGRDNADIALWGSSSVLAVPVFFDNVFYLMAPLARSMRSRIGKNYALYIVVVGAGAATTHVFVPPTPGPLAVADQIPGANLGLTIVVGLGVAIPSALVAGIGYGRLINSRLDIPLRESMGSSMEELEELSDRSVTALPGVLESLAPILIAVFFVASNTIATTFLGEGAAVIPLTEFIGNPNFALTAAALMAAWTYRRHRDLSHEQWTDAIVESLKNGGHIAAITCMGGAFGAMLAAAGIGDYIAGGLSEIGINLLITAWLIAAAVRIAQGSATVAMLTTAGIMAPLAGGLAVHPAYLVMAIGAGGNICSWYPDSGFWLVKEICGLTQAETLKTWTALTTIISVTGLVVVLVGSAMLPLV
ncbi:gluconate transporter [Haloprofundus marisrubri]|uniref:Gluconate transporter n=1 Tax=Haloprofundus marisrubri TaxID=1514971 RepID=A0A0W1R984_9EURY|nr:gluconate:H+ symporter [Haloprofundus marisrubri]KTG10008.1 gluconate transporter [Haloprofundus marisrubri]